MIRMIPAMSSWRSLSILWPSYIVVLSVGCSDFDLSYLASYGCAYFNRALARKCFQSFRQL